MNSSYQCDACGDGFETLTKLRLHECPEGGPNETPGPELVSDRETEKERPWEVEQNLEPEYDCPECEYYKTGLTTGPHAFLDHMQDEHGYSRSAAFDAMNG